MSDLFNVVVDAKEFRKVELQLRDQQKQAGAVIARALNRAATAAKTAAVKEVRQGYYVKAKDVNKTIKIYRASRSKLGAVVVSKDSKLPLDKFRFSPRTRPKRPPKGGIKVAVKKTGLKTLPHAFLVNHDTGTQIWQRVGKDRLPIRRLMGPAVPQMLGADRVQKAFYERGREMYEQRLDHEIKRLLEGGK